MDSGIRRIAGRQHPVLDIDVWLRQIPFESLQRYNIYDEKIPQGGEIVLDIEDFCEVERIRRKVFAEQNPPTKVPVDLIFWTESPASKPYLTKVGGVPHREAKKPWPVDRKGRSCTFIGQFCFVDSMDVVSAGIPAPVMLVFYGEGEYENLIIDREDLIVEWSDIHLADPMTAATTPSQKYQLDESAGVLLRTYEYPGTEEWFDQFGYTQAWLLERSQSSKIGRSTWFIQRDHTKANSAELFCAMSAYPGTTLEQTIRHLQDDDWTSRRSETARRLFLDLSFGDVGCCYFLIDRQGKIIIECDDY